jgi:hypothetical protein
VGVVNRLGDMDCGGGELDSPPHWKISWTEAVS